MSAQQTINSALLRIQRNFPQDSPQALSVELDKMYIDVARNVNDRTIGLFPMNRAALTGESWFLLGSNQKQQGQRQIYSITSFSNIAHGLNVSELSRFVRIFGCFKDSSNNWYPLPYVSSTAANQVGISLSSSSIVFDVGGSAPSPVIGQIVLEWVANP